MRVMDPKKLKTLGRTFKGTVVEAAKVPGQPFYVWDDQGRCWVVKSLTAKTSTRYAFRDRKTATQADGTVVLV